MSTASRNWSIFILSSCCSCSKSFHKLLNFLPPTATISISSTCCNYIPLLHSSAHSLAYLLLPLTLITYCSSICPSSSPSTFFSLHWRRNRRVWQTVEEKAEAVVQASDRGAGHWTPKEVNIQDGGQIEESCF